MGETSSQVAVGFVEREREKERQRQKEIKEKEERRTDISEMTRWRILRNFSIPILSRSIQLSRDKFNQNNKSYFHFQFQTNSKKSTHKVKIKIEQAKITLRGMAEHRFSNVYNYQCLTIVFTWILIFPLTPFPYYLLSSSYIAICNLETINGKSKQYQKQPGPFIQKQICFFGKNKIENWKIYSQAYISVV